MTSLKEQLIQIKENHYEVSNSLDLGSITNKMLQNIGAIDPELRDKLIYTTFYYWIIDKKYYTHEELIHILNSSIGEKHLLYQLGSTNNDSVFTRAFSVLMIPLLLERHRLDPFLTDEHLEIVKDRVISYFENEIDYRGYIEEKGWAHAIAHGADALHSIVECSCANRDDLLKILELVKAKMSIDNYVFINEEEERLINAIISIEKNGVITNSELKTWINSFQSIPIPNLIHRRQYFTVNVKGLLRSLYFRLSSENKKELLSTIEETLQKLSEYY